MAQCFSLKLLRKINCFLNMDQRVQRVIDFIEQDLRRELSLNEVAQSVNLSSSRLRHLFKAEIGMTPEQYRRSLRMYRAKEMIETTFLSIKEIRDQVGVSDRSRFMRDFKRAFHITPAHYRARFIKGSAGSKGSTDLSGLQVLLVEDDWDTREVLRMLLEHFGAEVKVVSCASEALATLERRRPDVLVADIGLLGEDGYEFIRRMRELVLLRRMGIAKHLLDPRVPQESSECD